LPKYKDDNKEVKDIFLPYISIPIPTPPLNYNNKRIDHTMQYNLSKIRTQTNTAYNYEEFCNKTFNATNKYLAAQEKYADNLNETISHRI
jgi:hypothetical protein